MDWIDVGYAAILVIGGAIGYISKGSKISLISGILFGSSAGYGAYCIAHNPRDVKISFFTAFILTILMGVRFKRSKKLMPGIIALLSLLMILRLFLKVV